VSISALSSFAREPGLGGGPIVEVDRAPGLGGGTSLLPAGFLVGPGVIDLLTVLLSESCAGDVDGISSHSFPAISRGRRKNGQSVVSSLSDSFASRVDIGTGEDLMIAAATSEVGRALRLRMVGVEVGPTGAEKSLSNKESIKEEVRCMILTSRHSRQHHPSDRVGSAVGSLLDPFFGSAP
jgi:hypothetical protein